MNFPDIFSKYHFRLVIMIVGILSLLYLIMNLFVIGGDAFVYNLNTLLISPLAMITSVSASLFE